MLCQAEGVLFLPDLQSVHSVVASALIAPVFACIDARNGALADILWDGEGGYVHC